jgi:hypothetical protein
MAQRAELLDLLNEEGAGEQFRRLFLGDAAAEWLQRENEPFYTAAAQLRLDALDFLAELIKCAGFRSPLRHPLVQAVDFYYYSGQGSRPDPSYPHLQDAELPLAAYLVSGFVFSYSFSARRWTERAWAGSETDPLLRLPYTRKYDVERAQFAERQERRDYERLSRASDLVGLIRARAEAVDLRDGSDFKIPSIADVGVELERDGLGFTQGMLNGVLNSGVSFEIVETERQFRGGEMQIEAGRTIAEGAYEGALSEVPYKSTSTIKQMALEALEALEQALDDLVGVDEEREEDDGSSTDARERKLTGGAA